MAEGGRGVAGEIVDRSRLGRQDFAGGDSALVSFEVARGVGRVEGVVPDEACLWVLVGVEVEVGVLGENEGYAVMLFHVASQE